MDTTETTTVAEQPEAPKTEVKKTVTVRVKKAKKAEKAKKTEKKGTAKKAPKAGTKKGTARKVSTESEHSVLLVGVMKKAGARSPSTARSLADLAEESGLDRREVYRLLRGGRGKADSERGCLVATGHARVLAVEGQGLSAYLTPQGCR